MQPLSSPSLAPLQPLCVRYQREPSQDAGRQRHSRPLLKAELLTGSLHGESSWRESVSKPSRPFSVFFSPDLHYDCHYSFNGAERQRALWILDNTSSQRPCCYTVSELHYLTVLRVNSESTGQASWCVRGSSEAQLPLMEKGSYSSTTCPSLFQHSS